MHEVTAYHCDHCSKIYTAKKVCKAHEKMCYSNPATKSCASCLYLSNSSFHCAKSDTLSACGLQTGCKLHTIHPDFIEELLTSQKITA